MEGEEVRSDAPNSFSRASIPKRILIVLAGGAVNIVFGLGVYFILVSAMGNFTSTTVGEVTFHSSKLQIQDEIVKVNGKSIHLLEDINKVLEEYQNGPVEIVVKRNQEFVTLQETPIEKKVVNTGLYFGKQGNNITTEIVALAPNSQAELSGFQVKDKIIRINGEEVNDNPYKIVELLNKYQEQEIVFTLERKNEMIDIKMTPNVVSMYHLGVKFLPAEQNLLANMYYGFWDTNQFAFSIIDNLKMLFTGNVKTDQLMGPIGISDVVAKTSSVYDFIYLLALISLSLRSDQPFTISTIRWRKDCSITHRSN